MTTSRRLGFDAVAEHQADEAEHRRRLARAVNRLTQGKMNCTLDATLDPGVATTTVTDARIGAGSFIGLMARSASAAAALAAGISVEDRRSGSAVLRHPVSAATDRAFTILILG